MYKKATHAELEQTIESSTKENAQLVESEASSPTSVGEAAKHGRVHLKERRIERRTAHTVQEENEFLNLVLESLPYPFYVIDVSDYSVIFSNSAAHRMSEKEASTCYALAHGRNRPCNAEGHPCPLETVKKTGQPATAEHIHIDREGRPHHIEVHAYPIFDREGNLKQVIEHSFDITQRKQMEAALREAEERFRTMSRAAHDAIIMMSPRGEITFWNDAAERTFGFSPDEALGHELHELLVPKRYLKNFRKGFGEFLLTGKGPAIGQTLELEAVRKGGEEFPIELSLSSVKIQGAWHTIGIVRDITERKSAETEREKLIAELQEALAKVKTLSGLLPICAACKKIRDDQGYWSQIESYISKHADVLFSHGICPDCAEELYPNIQYKS